MAAENFEGGIGENSAERERNSKRRHDQGSDQRTVAHTPGGREGQKAGMIYSLMLTYRLHFLSL